MVLNKSQCINNLRTTMKREMGVFIAVVILLFCSFSVSADVNINRLSGESVQMGANPISGVPQYSWYHGCSPTSGGMLFGYWDSHASGNWSNLVDGDVSTWNATAQNMVASPEHVADYWGTPDPNPEIFEFSLGRARSISLWAVLKSPQTTIFFPFDFKLSA